MKKPESRNGIEAQSHGPQIILNEDLLGRDVPYTVAHNPQGMADFLREFGMRDKRLQASTIELRRTVLGSWVNIPMGLYKRKKITIGCDQIWEQSQEFFGVDPSIGVNIVFQHEAKHALDAPNPFYRLVDSVNTVADLGVKIMLLPISFGPSEEADRRMRSIHYKIYNMRFQERRARNFTDNIKDNPHWANLITLYPKDTAHRGPPLGIAS